MGEFVDRARELRRIEAPHYNCAQAVFVPFAEQMGFTHEQAYSVAQAFGGGMQTDNVCGALVGALMSLGITGAADRETVKDLTRRFRENHEGCITCADLIRKNAEQGGDRHRYCDALVFEAVSLVERYLQNQGSKEIDLC
ncbi:MAG: C_GCAxxG_C_C family protein [Coriobacteriales bacterium]|nr:C_GCAxxG_C_C family protein [Coriobacteriales bacterium]